MKNILSVKIKYRHFQSKGGVQLMRTCGLGLNQKKDNPTSLPDYLLLVTKNLLGTKKEQGCYWCQKQVKL